MDRINYQLKQTKLTGLHSPDLMDDLANIFAYGYRLPWIKVKPDDELANGSEGSSDEIQKKKKAEILRRMNIYFTSPGTYRRIYFL